MGAMGIAAKIRSRPGGYALGWYQDGGGSGDAAVCEGCCSLPQGAAPTRCTSRGVCKCDNGRQRFPLSEFTNLYNYAISSFSPGQVVCRHCPAPGLHSKEALARHCQEPRISLGEETYIPGSESIVYAYVNESVQAAPNIYLFPCLIKSSGLPL